MAGQRHAGDGIREAGTGTALKRRGLIAGAAALAAGLIAKQASQPVGATSGGGPDGPLVMGSNFGSGGTPNTLSRLTVQVPTSTWSGAIAAMFGVDAAIAGNAPADTTALYAVGKGGGAGLIGTTGFIPPNFTALNAGVYGLGSAGKNGVVGQNDEASGIGVVGSSVAGVGVKGAATTGFPVIGQVVGPANINAGVLGIGTAGPGAQGQSTGGHGAVGLTGATDGHAALFGFTNQAGGIAVRGSVDPQVRGAPFTFAGVFDGTVSVSGNLYIGGSKSAYVKHPDGTNRLLYCEESPESWFADYGKGTLVNGRAEVNLDPDFAALVHADDYHVFLTEYGGHSGLYVAEKGPTGFTVAADAAAPSGTKAPTKAGGGTFSYRVVAKRKDIAGERLAKVAAPPALKPVTPFTVPETSVPKARPSATGADTMPGGGTP